MPDHTLDTLVEESHDLLPAAVDLRRELHRWPEQGIHNPITRDRILESLESLNLGVTRHTTTSGVAALHIDYRMMPEHRFPVAHDDMLAGFRWAAAHR